MSGVHCSILYMAASDLFLEVEFSGKFLLVFFFFVISFAFLFLHGYIMLMVSHIIYLFIYASLACL